MKSSNALTQNGHDNAFALHGLLATALLVLIGIHVAAALYRHFIRRDQVLARMIPRLRRGCASQQE